MECKKRNRNIRYAIFRDLNLNRIFNLNRIEFAKSNEIIFPYFCDRFSKIKSFFRFWTHYFFNIFGRFVKILRRTLKCFNRIQITST